MRAVDPTSDTAIRAMLVRRAHRADPTGLRDAAFALIEATEPRRGPWLAWPRPAWPATLVPGRASRQLVWLIAAAALLLALVSGTLVAGSLLKPRLPVDHLPLVPTGTEILSPDAALYDRVFEDGTGTLWAFGTGHLTRYNADGAEHRTWTLADDAMFGRSVAAAARAGGVWLWDGVTVRRFDGEGFAEVLPGPPGTGAANLAEAPDGSLWAEAWDGSLARRDGATWVAAPKGRDTAGAGVLLALGRDDVWVSNPPSGVSPGSISHLVGDRWETWSQELVLARGSIGAIAATADGSIWVTKEGAYDIFRFDGRSWTTMDGPGFPAWWLEPAPDGSVWAVTGEASALAVSRYRGGHWTTYGAPDGLEGTQLGHISVTPSGTFLGTDAGVFRFDGDRWTRVLPRLAGGPVAIGALHAVSADEAWAADARGIWHYNDGSWAGPGQLGDLAGARVRALAMSADGTLWAATDQGVAFLREGRWITAWRQAAWPIDVAPDGTAWAGLADAGIVGLRTDGTAPRAVLCPNGSMSIAVAADGTVWVGSFAYAGHPGLARFDGRTCETVDPLHDGGRHEVTGLAADPAGGLVALLLEGLGDGGGSSGWSSHLVRLDGTRWAVLEEQAKVDGAYSIMFTPSGELWRADLRAGSGLARLVDGRWVTVADVEVAGPVSVAPDGTAWVWTSSGVARLRSTGTQR